MTQQLRQQQVSLRVPGFLLTFGRHPARSALPRHEHEDPTICYVLHGRFTEYSRGHAADCAPATLKLTPAGEQHWNRFGDTDTHGLRIDVDHDRFADVPAIHRVLDERRHTVGGVGGALARRLIDELLSADDAGRLAVEGLALELLAELSREDSLERPASVPAWLLAAEELIHDGYRYHPSIGEIARTVGVHPATLSRAYRKRFGCTIGERIRALRVNDAARLLIETDEPLSMVALRAGFYDQSHFTNVFRRALGMTPAAYRSARRS